MTRDEALKLALEALEGYESCIDGYYADAVCPQIDKAITAIKEALAQPEQKPVGKFAKFTDGIWREVTDGSAGVPLYTTPPQRTWVGLMRGVRVEGDTVVISVKGGNDAARELCGALIEEMNR